MTVEELEGLKAHRMDLGIDRGVEDSYLAIRPKFGTASLLEILSLAIHGLNCQAAGITAERLGDIQMVPFVPMDEVKP